MPCRATHRHALRLISLIAFVAACGEEATAPVIPVPTAVEIEPATATLTAIGGVARLDATVVDQTGTAMPGVPVEWESLDASVATVTGAGSVVAHAAGTASIEARAGSVGELATVTVTPVPTSVAIEPAADTLNALGDTAALMATVQDPNGVVIADAAVTWASTADSVATVDDAGRVTAIAPGTATISATAGETSVEADIVVRQVAAALTVEPAPVTLPEDGSEQLQALVVDSNGAAIAGAPVAWSAADTATATVDGSGLVAAVFQGTTQVTASSGGVDGAATARVLGRISFTTATPDDAIPVHETFVMNADGTGMEQLEFLGASDQQVVWAPDRSRIAFVSRRSGNFDIWVANADGSGTPLNLTNDAGLDTGPAWSPDGKRIAYVREANDSTKLRIVNADGSSTPTDILESSLPSRYPAWSPDGLALAFARETVPDENFEIRVADPDARSLNVYWLTDPDSAVDDRHPAWSPDGRSIAFTRGPFRKGEMYVVDVDGTDLRRLTRTPGPEARPAWSPDGRRIVYTSTRDGNGELYIIDLETGEETRLTQSRVIEEDAQYLPRPSG